MKDIVALSKGERDRLVVLRQVKRGKLNEFTFTQRRPALRSTCLSMMWCEGLSMLFRQREAPGTHV